jgi:HD superfamily phosphohydrolase
LEIRDPVHGNIAFDETEEAIIDTPEMQRLRRIKQLDVACLIFPGANHTRFEHSLGVMHVTKELTAANRIVAGEFSCAALLHDIGHGPFSHLCENLVKEYTKKDHEQTGEARIRESAIRDIISGSGLSFGRVMGYFRAGRTMDIVNGALGSDRIDYLMRDAHYTGVAYGVIDYERLKSRLTISKGRIAIFESGIAAAEALLIARYFMHSNVYTHHAKIIAGEMLLNAAGRALEEGAISGAELSRMHDEQLVGALLGSGIAACSNTVKRVMERRIYKRAYYGTVGIGVSQREIAEAITRTGIGRDEFVVHVVSLPGSKDDIDVADAEGRRIGRLTELSPFIKTLNSVLTGTRKLLVACDPKNAGKANAAVRRLVS